MSPQKKCECVYVNAIAMGEESMQDNSRSPPVGGKQGTCGPPQETELNDR